jgi:CBS domain-containing protein
MQVQDLMTRDVITVRPEMPIPDAARLMVAHGVSGVPVVDDHERLVGVLTEADLMVRERPRPRTSWWRALFVDPDELARDYRKAAGLTVGEVMTRAVVTVTPDSTVAAAAELMHQARVRRLPVVQDGRLVGILSRADVVKAVAMAVPGRPGTVSDAQLVAEMQRRLGAQPWVSNLGIAVHARLGVLSLWGVVRSDAEREAIETMARTIEGVRGVESHLVTHVPVGT